MLGWFASADRSSAIEEKSPTPSQPVKQIRSAGDMHVVRTERRRHNSESPFKRLWFRDRVVDGYFFKAGPNFLEHLVALDLFDILDGGDPSQAVRKLGFVLPEQVYEEGDLGNEDVRLLGVGAGCDICGGRAGVGLLFETRKEACVRSRLNAKFLGQPHITEPCGRAGGGDVDRDKVPSWGDQDSLRDPREVQ